MIVLSPLSLSLSLALSLPSIPSNPSLVGKPIHYMLNCFCGRFIPNLRRSNMKFLGGDAETHLIVGPRDGRRASPAVISYLVTKVQGRHIKVIASGWLPQRAKRRDGAKADVCLCTVCVHFTHSRRGAQNQCIYGRLKSLRSNRLFCPHTCVWQSPPLTCLSHSLCAAGINSIFHAPNVRRCALRVNIPRQQQRLSSLIPPS